MRLNLLVTLTILPLSIFCQSSDSSTKRKLYFGLAFSPDYCYRTLKSDASGISEFIVDFRDSTEIPIFGYTTGLTIGLRISKRFSLETGLLYSGKGYKTKEQELSYGDMIDPRYGFVYTNNPNPLQKNTFIYRIIYIDFPLKLNYYIMTRKLKFYYSAGFSPNLFLTEKTTSISEYSDGSKSKKTTSNSNRYSKINLAFITGFGFSYDLTKKLYFQIEPTYRRSLTSIIEAPIKGYLYSFGFNSGLYYKL